MRANFIQVTSLKKQFFFKPNYFMKNLTQYGNQRPLKNHNFNPLNKKKYQKKSDLNKLIIQIIKKKK